MKLLCGSNEHIDGNSPDEAGAPTQEPLDADTVNAENANEGELCYVFSKGNSAGSNKYIDNWPNKETVARYKARCANHKR